MPHRNGDFNHLIAQIPAGLKAEATAEAAADTPLDSTSTAAAFKTLLESDDALDACGFDPRTRASAAMLVICRILADDPDQIDDDVLAGLGDVARSLADLPRDTRVARLQAFARGHYPDRP